MANFIGRSSGDSGQPAKRKLGRGLGSLIAGAGTAPVKGDPRVAATSSTMAPDSRTNTTGGGSRVEAANQHASSAAPSVRPRPGAAGGPGADLEAAEVLPRSGHADESVRADAVRVGDSAAPQSPPVAPATAPGVGARPAMASAGQRVHEIPLVDIVPNVHQPRQQFDPTTLKELAESMRSAGIMQPILVRPRGAGKFELIAGERRWRAAQLLELRTIPAIVREVDDRTAAEWALIENVQREDLNPMDRAAAFLRLIEQFGLSHQQIAERVGIDRTSVSNLIRLNELDQRTADSVRSGHLTLGHAKALLGCADPLRRTELGAAVLRNGWSVRRTEQAVRELNPTGAAGQRDPSARSLHLADLERRIGDRLGTRVAIETARATGSGTLRISYYSIAQFEGILARLGIDESSLGDG